jgi:excisionase family DNA binding protein
MLPTISMEKLGEEILLLSKKLNQTKSDYLCFNQACDYLGFKSSFMRKLVLERKIPFIKVTNKKLKFSRVELENWINSKSIKTMN